MRLPFVPGIEGTPFQKTLANNPAVRASFQQLSGANFFSLDPELFELVRLRVASNNECHYWRNSRDAALDEQKRDVAILKRAPGEADFTPREAVALEYTDQMMAYHGQVPDELMARVKAHFSNDELVALTFHIGLMNAANWFVISMQLESE